MPYGIVNTDTVRDSSGGILAPISSVFRNRIINGAMVINQRGWSGNVATDGTYTLDRWNLRTDLANKLAITQSSSAPVGFSNSLQVTTATAVASPAYYMLCQYLEGFNTADLGWGTANAKTVTLSFWVQSSLTGTFGGSITNSAESYSYPFSYTISAANTWEQKSVTITGPTAGTWIGATNGKGMNLYFGLGVGNSSSGTAGAWVSAGYYSTTGAVSVVSTLSATWYLTGVQLEVGSSATGFEYRQYGQELALCQRYCLKYCGNVINEAVNTAPLIGYNATTAYGSILTVVPMRTGPSISSSTMRLSDESNNYALTSIASSGADYSGPYNINCAYVVASSLTQYRIYVLRAAASTSANVILSAEL